MILVSLVASRFSCPYDSAMRAIDFTRGNPLDSRVSCKNSNFSSFSLQYTQTPLNQGQESVSRLGNARNLFFALKTPMSISAMTKERLKTGTY
jgi:hypothetical protein